MPTEKKAKPPKTPKTPKTAGTSKPKARSPRKAAPKLPKFRTGYVSLVGRPNAGKSTLLNSILGQKIAITSDKPQTTRLSILGIHTTPRGQAIFIDNPGIHKPLHKLNKRMMSFVYASLETADVICLLVDTTERFGHGDEFALEILKNIRKPIFLLLNKVDIVRKDSLLPLIGKYKDLAEFKEIIPISALKGTNLDVLEKLLFDNLPTAEKLYGDDDVSDQSERFLLAEIIREKVLGHVEQELPWATAVYIEEIDRHRGKDEGGGEFEAEEGGGPEDAEGEDAGLSFKRDEEPGEYAETGPGKPLPRVPLGATPRPTREERRSWPTVFIRASIFVEKDNHRKIIIGRQGRTVKTIGIEARREIEGILEARVYLELRVKVRERWRDSADVLKLIEGQKES